MARSNAVIIVIIIIIVLVLVYAIVMGIMFFTKTGIFAPYNAPGLKNGAYIYGKPVPLTQAQIDAANSIKSTL